MYLEILAQHSLKKKIQSDKFISSTGIPKDCQDGKLNFNVIYNGMELIDVDGPGGPLAPFYVYCNVREWTNTAVTEVASSR